MGDAEGQGGLASPVFFLDENHSGNRHLHQAFSEAMVRFEKHTDHFDSGVEDTFWIPAVAQRQWAVLTADARIRFNHLEREAVKRHGLRLFYFARNDFGGAEMATIIRKALPRMLNICQAVAPPFAASIHRNGEVHLRDIA